MFFLNLRKLFSRELPLLRAKYRLMYKRAKTVPETGVKKDIQSCLGPPVDKSKLQICQYVVVTFCCGLIPQILPHVDWRSYAIRESDEGLSVYVLSKPTLFVFITENVNWKKFVFTFQPRYIESIGIAVKLWCLILPWNVMKPIGVVDVLLSWELSD